MVLHIQKLLIANYTPRNLEQTKLYVVMGSHKESKRFVHNLSHHPEVIMIWFRNFRCIVDQGCFMLLRTGCRGTGGIK